LLERLVSADRHQSCDVTPEPGGRASIGKLTGRPLEAQVELLLLEPATSSLIWSSVI
jgi:hypothetical protein